MCWHLKALPKHSEATVCRWCWQSSADANCAWMWHPSPSLPWALPRISHSSTPPVDSTKPAFVSRKISDLRGQNDQDIWSFMTTWLQICSWIASFLGGRQHDADDWCKIITTLESCINSKCPSDESSTVHHVECIRMQTRNRLSCEDMHSHNHQLHISVLCLLLFTVCL